jgi:ABC-2 type transport system ATP-binding protein
MESNDSGVIVVANKVEKHFGSAPALDGVSLAIPRGRVVGLVGRNGSGKTTLLRILQGLFLPTRGTATVFGTDVAQLSDGDLARLGAVHQENRFLTWMSGRAHLDFVRSFYTTWDAKREQRLVDALELDLAQKIGTMSPGNVQKLAIVAATCHRPQLLLLDEPAAALDPLAREALLESLLELLREDGPAIVISSHALRDVERIVDWITCLERGRVVQDAPLDVLQEGYAEWRVTKPAGALPARFAEPWVVSQADERRQAVLCVRDPEEHRAHFATRYQAEVESRPLGLERLFPLWIDRRRS